MIVTLSSDMHTTELQWNHEGLAVFFYPLFVICNNSTTRRLPGEMMLAITTRLTVMKADDGQNRVTYFWREIMNAYCGVRVNFNFFFALSIKK